MRIFALLLLVIFSNDPREIAKINALKSEAESAFKSGDFDTAIAICEKLDSLIDDPALKLNLGHAFYFLGDTSNAEQQYKEVVTSTKGSLQSLGYQQLGFLQKQKKNYEASLGSFKQALLSDATNEDARYNFEVVKKLLKKQQEEEEQQENNEGDDQQEQENQEENDQQKDSEQSESGEGNEEENQEQQQEEGEQSEEEQEGEEQEGENEEGEEQDEQEPTKEDMIRKKLEEMNINEEKAKMILEALRNNEIQYIQQQKRRSTRPKSDKPDW